MYIRTKTFTPESNASLFITIKPETKDCFFFNFAMLFYVSKNFALFKVAYVYKPFYRA